MCPPRAEQEGRNWSLLTIHGSLWLFTDLDFILNYLHNFSRQLWPARKNHTLCAKCNLSLTIRGWLSIRQTLRCQVRWYTTFSFHSSPSYEWPSRRKRWHHEWGGAKLSTDCTVNLVHQLLAASQSRATKQPSTCSLFQSLAGPQHMVNMNSLLSLSCAGSLAWAWQAGNSHGTAWHHGSPGWVVELPSFWLKLCWEIFFLKYCLSFSALPAEPSKSFKCVWQVRMVFLWSLVLFYTFAFSWNLITVNVACQLYTCSFLRAKQKLHCESRVLCFVHFCSSLQ